MPKLNLMQNQHVTGGPGPPFPYSCLNSNEISRLSILADRDPAFRPGDLYSCLETTVEVVPFRGRQL